MHSLAESTLIIWRPARSSARRLPAAIRLHLHLLLHLLWLEQVEKHLLGPLHSQDEVESAVSILRPDTQGLLPAVQLVGGSWVGQADYALIVTEDFGLLGQLTVRVWNFVDRVDLSQLSVLTRHREKRRE